MSRRFLTAEDVRRAEGTEILVDESTVVTPQALEAVSYVRDLADGRRFANDSRGFLYLLDRDNRPSLYADVGAAFPLSFYGGLASGFIGFEFHPEFAQNGLFYTAHVERAIRTSMRSPLLWSADRSFADA